MVRRWRTGGSAEGKDQTTFYFTRYIRFRWNAFLFHSLCLFRWRTAFRLCTHTVFSMLRFRCCGSYVNGKTVGRFGVVVHFSFAYIISMCVEANVCAKYEKKLEFNFVVTMTTDKRCSILIVCNTPKSIVCLNRHEHTNRTTNERKTLPLERKGKFFISFGEDSLSQLHFSLANIRYIDFDE